VTHSVDEKKVNKWERERSIKKRERGKRERVREKRGNVPIVAIEVKVSNWEVEDENKVYNIARERNRERKKREKSYLCLSQVESRSKR